MLLEDVASGYTYLLGPQSYGKGQQNCGRIVMNTKEEGILQQQVDTSTNRRIRYLYRKLENNTPTEDNSLFNKNLEEIMSTPIAFRTEWIRQATQVYERLTTRIRNYQQMLAHVRTTREAQRHHRDRRRNILHHMARKMHTWLAGERVINGGGMIRDGGMAGTIGDILRGRQTRR
jgi:hypothetical protein